MKEGLDNPTELDGEGEPCFIVGKDGNTTDFTVGCDFGVISFTLNDTVSDLGSSISTTPAQESRSLFR
jgi:hypothetical protein